METGTPSMPPHFTALFRAYPDSHDEPNKISGSGTATRLTTVGQSDFTNWLT